MAAESPSAPLTPSTPASAVRRASSALYWQHSPPIPENSFAQARAAGPAAPSCRGCRAQDGRAQRRFWQVTVSPAAGAGGARPDGRTLAVAGAPARALRRARRRSDSRRRMPRPAGAGRSAPARRVRPGSAQLQGATYDRGGEAPVRDLVERDSLAAGAGTGCNGFHVPPPPHRRHHLRRRRAWTPTLQLLDPRYWHTAVWTGSEMIVFGGMSYRRHDLWRWQPLRSGAPTPGSSAEALGRPAARAVARRGLDRHGDGGLGRPGRRHRPAATTRRPTAGPRRALANAPPAARGRERRLDRHPR